MLSRCLAFAVANLLFASATAYNVLDLNLKFIQDDPLPLCSWCESDGQNKTCNMSGCSPKLSLFPTSVSSVVLRDFPFYEVAGQDFLSDAVRADVEVGIIVHHGAARNAGDYLCYMHNAALQLLPAGSFVLVSPQVFQVGDVGLVQETMIYWDEDGLNDDGPDDLYGAHDWKWGGDSTRSLPVGISTFQVLDEVRCSFLRAEGASRSTYVPFILPT